MFPQIMRMQRPPLQSILWMDLMYPVPVLKLVVMVVIVATTLSFNGNWAARGSGCYNYYIRGYSDQLRKIRRVFSAAEILQRIDQNPIHLSPPPPPPLIKRGPLADDVLDVA